MEDKKIYLCYADKKITKKPFIFSQDPSKKESQDSKEKMGINEVGKYRGKAFSLCLYKIKESFITNKNSLDKIKDE